MRSYRVFLISFFLLTSEAAHAAPSQLYNKTVTITWGESGLYTRVTDGKSANPSGQFHVTVYISSAGRPFIRASTKAGNFGSTRERGPEQNSNNVQFQGNSLVMVRENLGVARRILTTFDASFTTCTTSVTIGKVDSNATITGFDGAVYKVNSMQASGANCSIANGNALAN